MDFNTLIRGFQTNFNAQLAQQLMNAPAWANQIQNTQTPRPKSQTDKALDELLAQLAQLVNQAQHATDAEVATAILTRQSPLQPVQNETEHNSENLAFDLPPELAKLLQDSASQINFNTDDFEALKDQLRQLVILQQALHDVKANLEALKDGSLDREHQEQLLKQLEDAESILDMIEEAYNRRFARMVSLSWYFKWRQLYRDEMETKTNIKNEKREDKVSNRSLPEGVSATAAQVALSEEFPRPELQHGSEILKQLSNQADDSDLEAIQARLDKLIQSLQV
jgi:hypothetical protein